MSNSFTKAITFLETHIPDPNSSFNTMTLGRITLLAELVGNPEKKYPIIHVGGTSGKSSTATFAATILSAVGLKTGLHISPHLLSIRERMQINNKSISESAFCSLLEELLPTIAQVERLGLGKLTYFEITVVLAMLYFAREKVDAAVIEVGLGGTYDGTNIIPPGVAVLTNVSLDHTAILGKNVQKILVDKMGIIKKGSPGVVSGLTQPLLRKMITKRSDSLGVPLTLTGRDFAIEKTSTALAGVFQTSNFNLASQATSIFMSHFFPYLVFKLPEAIKRAQKTAFIPGRMETINKEDPLILLDGAHNNAKMHALVLSLKLLYPHQKWISVVGMKKDKSYKSAVKILDPITSEYIFTQFKIITDFGAGFGLAPEKLAESTHKVSREAPNIKDALELAKAKATVTNLPILITGSLYLVGEARQLLI